MVAAGSNPMDLRKGIMIAVERIEKYLDQVSNKIKDPKEIENVAIISTNNDKNLGILIAGIMNKIGADGSISVESGKTLDHEVEYIKGLEFEEYTTFES